MSSPAETLRVVTRVVRGQDTSDGAGVRLKRVIGSPGFDHVDPFLLLDEFKSDSSADYIAGFPDHPHRGFETVTYMLAGSMEHRDHIGNKGLLRAGSAQWMTAGHGIIHSEMPKQEHGLLWGFQLWVNLPARDKLCPPRYQDIAPEAIPEVALGDAGSARVVAGECNGVTGAVNGISVAPLYLDVTLKADATCSLPIPSGHTAFLYLYEGAARVQAPVAEDTRSLRAGELGLLGAGDGVRVTASSTAVRFLLVAGRPLREPVARYGPFVMNTREEIVQAVDDFRNGRLLV